MRTNSATCLVFHFRFWLVVDRHIGHGKARMISQLCVLCCVCCACKQRNVRPVRVRYFGGSVRLLLLSFSLIVAAVSSSSESRPPLSAVMHTMTLSSGAQVPQGRRESAAAVHTGLHQVHLRAVHRGAQEHGVQVGVGLRFILAVLPAHSSFSPVPWRPPGLVGGMS